MQFWSSREKGWSQLLSDLTVYTQLSTASLLDNYSQWLFLMASFIMQYMDTFVTGHRFFTNFHTSNVFDILYHTYCTTMSTSHLPEDIIYVIPFFFFVDSLLQIQFLNMVYLSVFYYYYYFFCNDTQIVSLLITSADVMAWFPRSAAALFNILPCSFS